MSTYNKNGVEIQCANCFTAMAGMPANSVDFIATDPPYFLDGMDADWSPKKMARRMKRNGVVRSLPAGMKYDRRQSAEFHRFATEFSTFAFRLLKPGGFFVAFSHGRLYHRLAVAAEDAGFEIRDMMAWKYEGQAKAFTQDHFVRKMDIPEAKKNAIIRELAGRKTPQLKPQMEPLILAQKPREGTFVENWLQWKTGLIDTTASLDGMFPGTIMEVAKPKNGRANGGGHLTVKPIDLMAHLIRVFTTEKQVVLDPFLGSGTTALAAQRTGRHFVGYEVNQGYCDTAISRVRAECKKNHAKCLTSLGEV